MKAPTVSVTIPTYNRAAMLKIAVDSVLGQTFQDFEVIVVDDGSTDNTADVIAAYGDRVRYVRQPNGGLGAARTKGLELATGEYVAFLDSDDAWFDFKLALQVRLLEALPDVGFLFTEFTILHSDGRRTSRGSRTWLADPRADWASIYPEHASARSLGVEVPGVQDYTVYWGAVFQHMLREALVLPTTAIARRSAIGALRLTERMTIFEDWEFFALLGRNHQACFVDLDTAFNRSHEEPGRLTRCEALSKAESYAEIVARVWKSDTSFAAAHPDLLRETECAAVLAVAREALLASRPEVARAAINRLSEVGGQYSMRGLTYNLLTTLPVGRQLLRAGIVSRNLVRLLLNGGHAHYPVNPAA